ncbi:MAG TPA: toprim domain-containing protein [Candidatus Nanoarchaeia archaeon]|nr:toprim domain-containing protein [Candidatus Nanoarchaeia archaeon]
MAYKTYTEQINEHLLFLKSKNFEISELKVNADFVRSHQTGKSQYRGELAYKTRTIKLKNGLTGVQTWFRDPQGESSSFQTYGLGPTGNEEVIHLGIPVEEQLAVNVEKYNTTGRKAYGFWQYSASSGRSEYLERKKVGCYGIRFRSSTQYGDVAVIPMVDVSGRLWNYQLLNPDGTKRQPKEGRTEGLFHMIGTPNNGHPIGIAESYVTSASCFELTGIPVACAFSCQNLKSIVVILKQCYPNSKLIVFADNDKHLEMRGGINQGLEKGREAIQGNEDHAVLVAPDFDFSEPSKKHSDWNDLIAQKGFEHARAQIAEKLSGKNLQKKREYL